MPALLLYLLKVNVALVLFYLAYHLVLRRLTFYTSNRLFLVFGVLFSSLYPFVDITEFFSRQQALANTYRAAVPAWVNASAIPEHAPVFDYWQIPVLLLWAGTIMMLLRLLVQFAALYKIHAASEPAAYKGIAFRQIKNIVQAFSFWQTIYLNPDQYNEQELASILRHEQVHVKQWHTLDVLLAELSTVLYWFNPGVWLLKKAIKENLEFIADQHVVGAGTDRKLYQYLLLKVTGAPEPQVANQFNFPSLKKRIAMMNKIPTKKRNQLRLLVALPIVAVLLFAFRSAAQNQNDKLKVQEVEIKVTDERINPSKEYREVAQDVFIKNNLNLEYARWTSPHTLTIKPTSGETETYQLDNELDLAEAGRNYGVYLSSQQEDESSSGSIRQGTKQDLPDEYKAFYARNPQVRKVSWKSGNEIVIRLASEEEVYRTDDKRSMAAAEKKYGKLPASPPPAEKVTQAEFDAREKKAQQIFVPEDVDYYQDKANLPVAYTNFLKRNQDIEKIGWRIDQQTGPQAIVVFLKSGGTEEYTLSDANSMVTAAGKYGKLPDLLPPPPPVMIKQD